MPDRTGLDERTEELCDRQRVAFRLPIDIREELATHLLPVERRLEPLLHFVARETRDRHLAHQLGACREATFCVAVVHGYGVPRDA
ncbi:MAG TPA: hypothetical protein VFQ35_02080, partial [Polyangiaceae bacterium]|nr:hypothetical protein [Polyangiaceae bacterium]